LELLKPKVPAVPLVVIPPDDVPADACPAVLDPLAAVPEEPACPALAAGVAVLSLQAASGKKTATTSVGATYETSLG